jgi:hypothetical protein
MFQNVTPPAAIIEIILGFALGYAVPLLVLKWYVARLRRRLAQRQTVTDRQKERSTGPRVGGDAVPAAQ